SLLLTSLCDYGELRSLPCFPTRRSSDLSDDALFYTMPWVLAKVVPLAAGPAAALARVHRAALAKAQASGAGSPLQLAAFQAAARSEEHTSELQSRFDLVCRLLLEKKK